MPLYEDLIGLADRYWAIATALTERADAIATETTRLLKTEGGWDAPAGSRFQSTVQHEVTQLRNVAFELQGLSTDLRRYAGTVPAPR